MQCNILYNRSSSFFVGFSSSFFFLFFFLLSNGTETRRCLFICTLLYGQAHTVWWQNTADCQPHYNDTSNNTDNNNEKYYNLFFFVVFSRFSSVFRKNISCGVCLSPTAQQHIRLLILLLLLLLLLFSSLSLYRPIHSLLFSLYRVNIEHRLPPQWHPLGWKAQLFFICVYIHFLLEIFCYISFFLLLLFILWIYFYCILNIRIEANERTGY